MRARLPSARPASAERRGALAHLAPGHLPPLALHHAGALALAIVLLDLLPGVVLQAYFDAVSGHPNPTLGVWTAVALTLLVPLARTVTMTTNVLTDTLLRFVVTSLVHRNLLAGVFRRPGAQALDTGGREAANRFRDDTPRPRWW